MTKTHAAPITLTLTLRRVWPDGGAGYVCDGLEGTVYVKKGMLAGENPPQTLTLTGSGLADPVAVAAERNAKAETKAARDAERRATEAAEAAAAEQPAPPAAKPDAPAAKPAARKGKKAA